MKNSISAMAVCLFVCVSSAQATELTAGDKVTALVATVQELALQVSKADSSSKCGVINSSSSAILDQVNTLSSSVYSDEVLAESIIANELGQVVDAISILKNRHQC